MKERSNADAIVEFLILCGTEVVFGFPGESSLPFYLSIQKQRDRIRHIIARSPRGAAYMADAYSRVLNKPGVVDCPGGIGSPFILPALLEAFNSSIPLIVIASGSSSELSSKWLTSTCDQQAIFAPACKKVFLLNEDTPVEMILSQAWRVATTGRFGPVVVEIPSNLFGKSAMQLPWKLNNPGSMREASDGFAETKKAVERARELLWTSIRPTVVIGGGYFLAENKVDVVPMAEQFNVPVATTLNGKGAFPEDHHLSLGVCGGKGLKTANDFIRESDTVLVFGSKLGDKTTDGFSLLHSQRVFQVDISIDHLSPPVSDWNIYQADLSAVISQLCERCSVSTTLASRPNRKIEQVPHWPKSMTSSLCLKLPHFLTANSIIVADASVSSGWAAAAVKFYNSGQRLLAPRGTGSLSYALPAAIGAQIAAPESQVVGIGGDGAFLMSIADLESAVRFRLPIRYILLDNQRLNLIDKHARDILGGEPVSSAFGAIDWLDVIRGFGWKVIQVLSENQMDDELSRFFESEGPVVLHVRVPTDEMSPDYILTKNRKTI